MSKTSPEIADTTVGIIGAGGDLGRPIVHMAAERGFQVLKFDVRPLAKSASLKELIDSSDFVHFALAEPDFDTSYEPGSDGQIRILHDSVMATSKSINSELFDNQADIVHMLMNKKKTVVVEKSNPHIDEVSRHMSELGLNVKVMSADEHDHVMARSQAPLAILVKLLLSDLQSQHEQGVLTASGDALLTGLEARSANWTDPTMKAILKNPQLPGFIDDMESLIANGGEVYGNK